MRSGACCKDDELAPRMKGLANQSRTAPHDRSVSERPCDDHPSTLKYLLEHGKKDVTVNGINDLVGQLSHLAPDDL